MHPDAAQPSLRAEFILSRWLFLRLLGLVYLIAFVSLWSQIHGLIGSQGILPAQEFLDAANLRWGAKAWLHVPTLCWVSASDTMLTCLCAVGTVASAMLIVGIAPLPCLALLWVLYLSLSVVGQVFLGFQWDTLLLEAGFLAVFMAPRTLRPGLAASNPPHPAAIWLLWWLLFKLMFLSGVTKLLSGDSSWRDLTAMEFHYETQPIPNWISWYVHQLQPWWQKISVLLMFAGELLVPFLIFAPRVVRHVAAVLLVGLQAIIEFTGNFGFFNLLTIAICVSLLDDRALSRLVPAGWRERLMQSSNDSPRRSMWFAVMLAPVFLVSFLTFVREMVWTQNQAQLPRAVTAVLDASDRWLLSWGEPYVLRWIQPFRTINGYGLFRVMTTERPEIVIEVSNDGTQWVEYEFKWKPGDLQRAPPFVAPHQPRLDWQMWFAALHPAGSEYWLRALMQRLLEGSPPVADLLGESPLGNSPPRYIRLVYYRYEFTKGPAGSAWWQRTKLGHLTPPMSLPRR
jgi:hypothetical protein